MPFIQFFHLNNLIMRFNTEYQSAQISVSILAGFFTQKKQNYIRVSVCYDIYLSVTIYNALNTPNMFCKDLECHCHFFSNETANNFPFIDFL